MKLPAYSALVAAMLSVSVLLTACSDNDDDTVAVTPVVVEPTPKSISLEKIGGFATGVFAESAAEIPAFDPASKRGFIVNAQKGVIDVLDLSNPAAPKFIRSLDATAIAANAIVNSVAVKNGIVAVAIESSPKTSNGFVGFYKASDFSLISSIGVGALPDMLVFSPDGKTVLVANEAEPSDDYKIDPEGSISVINISDISKPTAKIADFTAFNSQVANLRAKGVRIFGPNANAAKDFEPEYITVSEDGKTAWIALQENNALAKLDIATAKIVDILPLGFKDHGLAGNGMDVSDRDDKINIQRWTGDVVCICRTPSLAIIFPARLILSPPTKAMHALGVKVIKPTGMVMRVKASLKNSASITSPIQMASTVVKVMTYRHNYAHWQKGQSLAQPLLAIVAQLLKVARAIVAATHNWVA